MTLAAETTTERAAVGPGSASGRRGALSPGPERFQSFSVVCAFAGCGRERRSDCGF